MKRAGGQISFPALFLWTNSAVKINSLEKQLVELFERFILGVDLYMKFKFLPLQSFKKGIDSVAQLVEHYTFNVVVLGSNPSGITEKPQRNLGLLALK